MLTGQEGVPAHAGVRAQTVQPETLLQPAAGPRSRFLQRPGGRAPGPQSESASPRLGWRAVRGRAGPPPPQDALPAPWPPGPGPPLAGVAFTVLVLRPKKPRHRNRSPRAPASMSRSTFTQAAFPSAGTNWGQRPVPPPCGWPAPPLPPPGLAWAPGLTACPWDGQGRPDALPRACPQRRLLDPPCFACSRPHCRTMT